MTWSTTSPLRQFVRSIGFAAAVFAAVAVTLTACYLVAWVLVDAVMA